MNWITSGHWTPPHALQLGLRFLLLLGLHSVAYAAIDTASLYHNYCSVCHGDKGDGKSRASAALSTAPRDFTSELSRLELTRERIVLAITHGRPGTAMVSWKSQLSESDIAALAEHVLTRFVRGESSAASPGKHLYDRNCAVCHGDKGAGAVWASANMARPPRNFAAPQAQQLTRETMVAAVTHGMPGTPMAGFASRLTGPQIEVVVDFIRSEFMNASISGTRAHGGRQADLVSTPAPVDMLAGLPNGLKGDIKRGGAFYLANCATCHGTRGDGAGPRAYFINPKPRNFVEAASRERFNRAALYVAVSEGRLGSEMPAWNKVASAQQIADVSEYVFRSFIQLPPAAQGLAVEATKKQ